MLASYLSGGMADFIQCHHLVPDIHQGRMIPDELGRPRFIKSHASYFPAYRRVVYLVRDGRDVAVSYYFFCLKYRIVDPDVTFEDFIPLFNQRNRLDQFGIWSDHVKNWLRFAPKKFLLVRYEDMLQNPSRELIRILKFAGITIDQQRVDLAVQAGVFERMQKIEVKQYSQYEALSKSDPSIPLIREGKAGTWGDYFSDPALLDQFMKVHGSVMAQLGYKLSTD